MEFSRSIWTVGYVKRTGEICKAGDGVYVSVSGRVVQQTQGSHKKVGCMHVRACVCVHVYTTAPLGDNDSVPLGSA